MRNIRKTIRNASRAFTARFAPYGVIDTHGTNVATWTLSGMTPLLRERCSGLQAWARSRTGRNPQQRLRVRPRTLLHSP